MFFNKKILCLTKRYCFPPTFPPFDILLKQIEVIESTLTTVKEENSRLILINYNAYPPNGERKGKLKREKKGKKTSTLMRTKLEQKSNPFRASFKVIQEDDEVPFCISPTRRLQK
jgi:hypothetical protein